jgi:hypothetical protein
MPTARIASMMWKRWRWRREEEEEEEEEVFVDYDNLRNCMQHW